ncbi:hypothetical protein AeNC1_011456 [Aphanomyces euteiches]|nr:hypothetical protein AeNC1_011456 [Aphanomyces euteiches]
MARRTNEKADRSFREPGDEIIGKRILDRTYSRYKGIIDRITKWLCKERPGCIHDGAIKLPLELNDCKAILTYCSIKRNRQTSEEIVPRKYNSFSTINGCLSAIQHLYSEDGIQVSSELKDMMTKYSHGYRRHIANLKQSGEMSLVEGKSPMSVAGYRFLAKKAISAQNDFGLACFAHTFLVLCWNLMARSTSTASIRYQHITWRGDALIIEYGLSKSDQEVNCARPATCMRIPHVQKCVQYSAILLFTSAPQIGPTSLLFGEKAQARFTAWLSSTCNKFEEDILAMGLLIAEIGTHSFRKGVATSVGNNPGGPSPISVWLRAGWSLGNVQSGYIFEETGGDQFIGRCATGLNLNDISFASLPPHFSDVLSTVQWESILPGYSKTYPPAFRCAVPYLLASLVYHRDWVQSNFATNHPIFLSLVWKSGILESLVDHVHAGIHSSQESGLVASGIPPSIPLAIELEKIKQSIQELTQCVSKSMDSIPDLVGKAVEQQGHSHQTTQAVTMNLLNQSLDQFGENLLKQMSQFARVPDGDISELCELPAPEINPNSLWLQECTY